MKTTFINLIIFLFCISVSYAQTIYDDSEGDIDPGIANAGGTLDILSMEVSNTATDVIFTLTVNGDISTIDWGNFMIGISTGSIATTDNGNGWNRPIELNSTLGGIDYWIGSWVNDGGGSQFWSYNIDTWSGPSAIAGYTLTSGATSTIEYTVSVASLGLGAGDSFYFDAYSSGGGETDGAVDALSNPNVSITAWDQSYTSNSTNGISQYTLADPLPVELTSFSANLNENKVTLNWQTATEVNNYGFFVERSQKSGVGSQNDWSEIGFIEGNGNSNSTKQYSFTDDLNLNPNLNLVYRLKQIDIDGSYSYSYSNVVEVTCNLQPSSFELFQNYPNPFNPITVISYQLPVISNVQLKIYDILGNEVATLVNEQKEPGVYEVEFNASELPSGIYFYQFHAGSFCRSRKFILMK